MNGDVVHDQTVGLIGVGLVGSALARRLTAGGFRLIAQDIDPAARERVESLGGTFVTNVHEVALSARRIVLSLPTSSIVLDVVRSLEPHLQPGSRILDTTTGDPDDHSSVGSLLAGYGVGYVDGTLAGSSVVIGEGKAVAMLGGDANDVSAFEDLLPCFCETWFHLGPVGSGARMKLVVNLVLGLNRAVLAEGLAFAARMKIEPRKALEVLMASPAFSQAMVTKGEKMLSRDFTPQARLQQHRKDVDLILDQAERTGAEIPLSRLHRELLTRVEQAGFGGEDNSAILRAFDPRP